MVRLFNTLLVHKVGFYNIVIFHELLITLQL